MAQTRAQILAELNERARPQTDLVNQQMAALPEQERQARQGIEADRNQAFEQVDSTANSMGMLYSGRILNERNKYNTGTYLTSRNNVTNSINQNKFKLQSTLADIAAGNSAKAYDMEQEQVQSDRQEQERQRQYQLQVQKLQQVAAPRAAAAPRASSVASKPNGGYKVTYTAKGLAYKNAAGQPITSAQYYDAQGATDLSPIIADLRRSSNPGDKAIADAAASGKYTQEQLIKKYPYVFGAV